MCRFTAGGGASARNGTETKKKERKIEIIFWTRPHIPRKSALANRYTGWHKGRPPRGQPFQERGDGRMKHSIPRPASRRAGTSRGRGRPMGLQIVALSLSEEDKVMGKAIFKDTAIRLNTPEGERIIRVGPGTIVVNSKYKQNRNQWNTIIIHECCHFYEHDLFIWGQTQYNEQLVGIDCPITRGRYPSQGKSPVFWAERQARMMTYRVKMNKLVTRAKAEEYRQQYWRAHPNGSEEW